MTAPELDPADAAPRAVSAAQYRVHLADDDPAMLRLLSTILERQGYLVESSPDGTSAFEAIQRNCPDFLILDWEMPGLTGPEVCRRLRALSLPHYVYTLLLTGRSQMESVVEGLDAGADDYLAKPVVAAELVARLNSGQRVLSLEAQLRRNAALDPLTGLLNRRAFFDQFSREWARANRAMSSFACVILDIDLFKSVNDQFGHATGDHVIQHVADVLRECSRTSDYICRYGGEEFCALLPETDEYRASVWADRVREMLQDTKFRSDQGVELRLSASFGVAGHADEVPTPEALLDRADQALLAAKQSGRNRVIRYESIDKAPAHVDVTSLTDLFAGVVAREVMNTPISVLHVSDNLDHASKFLTRLALNSAPVVNDQGKLAGILSEKDLLVIASQPLGWGKSVGDIMTSHVVSFTEETSVGAIYDFLMRLPVRRVVIVQDERPTGVISRGAMLRWLQRRLLATPHESPAAVS